MRQRHFHILCGNAAFNRGDRGNLEAQIALLRERFPDADLSVASFRADVDKDWYDAEVVQRGWLLTLAHWRALRRADVVIWGGGALVADNACRSLLPLWIFLLALIRFVLRKPVMAWGHGVVLETRLGRVLAKVLFRWVDAISVRDVSSYELVTSLGPRVPVHETADVAVTVRPAEKSVGLALLAAQGVPVEKRRPIFGVSLTYWPFYHQSRDWLPYALARRFGLRRNRDLVRLEKHQRTWTELLDLLVETHDADIVLLPRYPCEPWRDVERLRELAQSARHCSRIFVYDDDSASPRDYLAVFRCFEFHLGTALHDGIFAAAVGVRAVTFPYESKCRDFFHSIGADDRTLDWKYCFEAGGARKMADFVAEVRRQPPERDAEIGAAVTERQGVARKNADLLEELLAAREKAPLGDASVRRFRTAAVLTGVLVVAAALRVYHLGFQSFHNDEMSTLWRCDQPSFEALLSTFHGSASKQRVYYFLGYFLVQLFGPDPMVFRWLSAVAGILSIAAIYQLGKRLFGRASALLAASLAAVVPMLVRYSQIGRVYSLFTLCALLSTYFCVELLADAARGKRIRNSVAVAYLGTAWLTLALHYFGFFAVLFQACACALVAYRCRARYASRPVLAIGALLFLASVPVIWWLAQDATSAAGLEWIAPPRDSYSRWKVLYDFFGTRPVAWASWLALIPLAVGGALAARRWSSVSARARLGRVTLAAFVVSLLAFVYVKSLYGRSIWVPRYLILCLPAGCLLAGHAMRRCIGPGLRRTALTASTFIALGTASLVDSQFYEKPQNVQGREVYDTIAAGPRRPILYYGSETFEMDWYGKYFAPHLHVDRQVEKGTVPSLRETQFWLIVQNWYGENASWEKHFSAYVIEEKWSYVGYDLARLSSKPPQALHR